MAYKVQFIEVWTVYETVSEWGQQGRRVGVFTRETDAEVSAIGRGYFGGHGAIEQGLAVSLDGLVYVLKDANPVDLDVDEIKSMEERVAQAKAKLTPEERKLLGL